MSGFVLNFLLQREFKQLRIDAIKNDVKESAELPKAPGLAEDEDVPCCVCNERDSSDDNLIVFCDGCDIAIHQGNITHLL